MPPRPEPSRHPGLAQLEHWMLEVVMHPGGAAEGVGDPAIVKLLPAAGEDLEKVVLPSATLSSVERLAVYADMYYWRLVDILFGIYPAVQKLMGGDLFYDVARAYLAAHPSRSPHLGPLGRRFPDFIRSTSIEIPHRGLAADLAAMENAMDEIFDEVRHESVSVAAIDTLPPDAFGRARLRFASAMRVLVLDHPANDWYQAFREEREVPVPAAETSRVLLYRRDFTVYRAALGREEHALLVRLMAGDNLVEALEACSESPGIDMDLVLSSIGGWFRHWSGNGLIAAIDLED